MKVPRVIIGGTQSGVGKTTVTTGVMGALAREGRKVQGFKVGPDFLDPSFHTAVTGRPSRNLDSWMIPRDRIRELMVAGSQNADVAVVEGVMGLFDGMDGKSELASTSEMAKIIDAPVILIIDAYNMAASAAALVVGYRDLDPKLRLAGVILNRVAGGAHAEMCREAIARHTKIPVLGAVPFDKNIHLPERHLGLFPPTERKPDLLKSIVEHVKANVNIDEVEKIADSASELDLPSIVEKNPGREKTTIAVAHDRAFSFYYQENFDQLVDAGARIVHFSPLDDNRVPEGAGGIYIGGGYPELYATQLSENHAMRDSILKLAEDQIPIYAECGGMMYLTKSIQDLSGLEHRTVGVLDGNTTMVNKLTLSYTLAKVARQTILHTVGGTVRGHEFHFSQVDHVPSDAKFAYELELGRGVARSRDGWTCHNVLASYMHTNFASDPSMAERFVESAVKYYSS